MSDADDLSIFELFRMEAEERVVSLQRLLLQVQGGAADKQVLHALMRDAHSLKGAARITEINTAVGLTHSMEDRFVAAEEGRDLTESEVDALLRCVDLLRDLSELPGENDLPPWEDAHRAEIEALATTLSAAPDAAAASGSPKADETRAETVLDEVSTELNENVAGEETASAAPSQGAEVKASGAGASGEGAASSLRMSSARLRRIMAGASNNLVRQQSLIELSEKLTRNEERMYRSLRVLMDAAEAAEPGSLSAAAADALRNTRVEQQGLRQLLLDLDTVAYGSERIANGLHREILQATMRPVREVVPSWQRLVRGVAAELGKKVKLEVVGERTDVDRDILEQLRAPMEHLLRNSLDHGFESPEVRRAAGKPEQGTLRVWARHQNGRLAITVSDDGGGVDFRAVRARAESRGLVLPAMAAKMSEDEILQFLFLPGFSTRDVVSELSGRGVGLDVVQSTVHGAGGSIRIETKLGQGTAIHLTLPISRSVLRVMLVSTEEETYALPTTRLARVDHVVVNVDADGSCTVGTAAGRVPIVPLIAAVGGTARPLEAGRTPAIFLLDSEGHEAEIALAVDRLLGDSVVAVQEVDPRLGRSGALAGVMLTETGAPMLILAADYLLRIALGIHRRRWAASADASHAATILVADDSPTIRQMLRRVLVKAEYRVVVAEHGAEAWALLQTQPFDLLISDVDMPEMNGIELTMQVRDSSRLQHTPVILLSYKGRDEDRRRGLEAGADMYFSKGEFEETAFLQVVTDMIGPAQMSGPVVAAESAPASNGHDATA